MHPSAVNLPKLPHNDMIKLININTSQSQSGYSLPPRSAPIGVENYSANSVRLRQPEVFVAVQDRRGGHRKPFYQIGVIRRFQ